MNPTSLRYVLCVANPHHESDLVVGEFYALHWDTEDSRWTCALTNDSTHFWSNEEEIAELFAPASREQFQASIDKAMADLGETEVLHEQIVREISGVNQMALGSGDDPSDDPADLADAHDQKDAAADLPSDTSLALKSRRPAGQLRNKAHALKRKITTLAETVKSRRELVESKIKQQLALFQSKVDEMEAMVAKLTEVVQMVNLYLGRDEEITCLRDGPKAPAGTPIAIRQGVLFMDEECAEDFPHGIDFTEIERFDKWLMKPANLKQVIPNEKGIIVLQVRRNAKFYEGEGLADAIANLEKNKENMKSYWLIKNGQRLHRLWTDIAVGVRLVPREDELDHFFVKRERDWDTRETKETVIRPGSKDYYKAMDAANAHRRHYMRLLLVLQGLFDRTQLLAPYTGNVKPNLMDERTWEGNVIFVRDTEKVIEDGRPTFRDWLDGVNRELRHGHRIAGYFPSGSGSGRDRDWRITPKTAAAPSGDEIYSLVEHAGRFSFAFRRTDQVWTKPSWRTAGGLSEPKRRASYRIDRGDTNFVCIDNASISDMEYYIKDRRHRKDYESLIPALRAAIALKKKESEQEQPFRALLLAKLAKLHPETPCTEEKLESLIGWWKFKVKEHRALLADNQKAYQMILAEYARQSTPAESLEFQSTVITRDVIGRLPDVLAAWHKGGGEFVILRAVDGYPVFVHEETWKVKRDTAVRTQANLWHIPHKADYLRWGSIYVSPAWAARPAQPDRRLFISEPDMLAATEWAKANPPKGFRAEKPETILSIYADISESGTSLTVVVMQERAENSFPSFGDRRSKARRSLAGMNPLEKTDDPEFRERTIARKKTKGQLTFSYTGFYSGSTSTFVSSNAMRRGWEPEKEEKRDRIKMLWLDEVLDKKIDERLAKNALHDDRVDVLHDWCSAASDSAEEYLMAQWRALQELKYLDEQGDPDFFDDHLKTLPKLKIVLDDRDEARTGLEDLLAQCVMAVHGDLTELTGKTVAQALHHCGLKAKKPLDDVITILKSDWVLPLFRDRGEHGGDVTE